MKKVLMSLLFGSFLLTGSSFAQNPPPAADAPAAAPSAAAAPEAPKPVVSHHHEKFPELNKAMRKLRGAKQDLAKAGHDYDGHKAKAIEAINQALDELKAAKESAAK